MDEISAAEVDLADMPATLRELAAVIGIPATLTLVRHYGGVRLYIPRTVEPGHILVRLIGHEAAQRLANFHMAGDTVVIPLAVELLRAQRNRAIRARMARGDSAADVARAFGITERHVWRIADGAAAEDRQESLF